jgi:hypothetical protein
MVKLSNQLFRALVRQIRFKLDDSSKKTQTSLVTKVKKSKELAKLKVLQLEQERLIKLIDANYSTETHKVVVEYSKEKKEYCLTVQEVTSTFIKSYRIEDELSLLTELSNTVYTADELIEKVIQNLKEK